MTGGHFPAVVLKYFNRFIRRFSPIIVCEAAL